MSNAVARAVLAGSLLAAGIWSLPAAAQDSPYRCVNDSVRIDIRAQSMARALDQLSRQTRCPISRDGKVDGVRSNRVTGTFTPEQALKALIKGTGLNGRSIKQGLTVSVPARIVALPPVAYDCQNISRRIDVREMPLDRALDRLSEQTRCPISRDFPVSGLVSRPVAGMFTPLAALRGALEGTGLHAATVRQGLQVLPVR